MPLESMLSLSNGISLLRAPLALLFLIDNPLLRICALILAMLTDVIDGYLARRYSRITKVGVILDPLMDKFFVYFVLGIFLTEGKLELWQAGAMLSRDFFLWLFGIYLAVSGNWETFRFKAIGWGKVSTALQFLVLMALTLNVPVSLYVYCLFILFGMLAFIELCQKEVLRLKELSSNEPKP
jgi:CDP-diacylglycerol---glycerol-3-phosphate 3-phosphatidyltransferase